LLLDQPSTIAVLQKADPGDPGITDLIQQVKQIDPNISTVSHFQAMVHADLICTLSRQIEGLLNTGLGLAKDYRGKPLYIALKTFSGKLKDLRKLARADASHHDKRSFVSYDCISV
jgi:hypothetical protein